MVQLFERARILNTQKSRPPVECGNKLQRGLGGERTSRAYRIASTLWPGSDRPPAGRELALYRKLRDNLEPLYRIGIKLEWRWLVAIKDLIKQRLGAV